MIRLEKISFSYADREIFKEISLRVRDGNIVALLGANGAGKSTLLKIMSGWLKPSSGCIFFGSDDISKMSNSSLARRRAVLEQECSLSFDYTVLETVSLSTYALPFDDSLKRAERALAEVGLSGFGKRIYTRLSGGEKRRVQIARALCQLGEGKERIGKNLLFDEASAGLDPAHANSTMRAARKAADDGCAVVSVMHDPNLAAAFADEIVLLKDGAILAMGPVSEIMNSSLLSQTYSSACEIAETKSGRFAVFPSVRP